MHSTMHLYPIDGAVHRVAPGDTAFSFRDARWAEVRVRMEKAEIGERGGVTLTGEFEYDQTRRRRSRCSAATAPTS